MKANRRFTKKKALIMNRSDARIAEEHGNSKEITTALTEILIKAGKFQESESSLFAKATYKGHCYHLKPDTNQFIPNSI